MAQSSIQHIKRINWNKLDLSDEVNIAAQMIVSDIRQGIQRGLDINDNTFIRLKDSTVRSKRKKGSKNPSKPLWDEGIMKEVYVKPLATKAKPRAKIRAPKGKGRTSRVKVGIIHNTGDGVPKRQWFGIGSRVAAKLDKAMKLQLKEKLKIGRIRGPKL